MHLFYHLLMILSFFLPTQHQEHILSYIFPPRKLLDMWGIVGGPHPCAQIYIQLVRVVGGLGTPRGFLSSEDDSLVGKYALKPMEFNTNSG